MDSRELRLVVDRLRRNFSRNADVMMVCDELVHLHVRELALKSQAAERKRVAKERRFFDAEQAG